ncbi:MAG: hypothetical protein N2589_05655 [bacterium]|nr:hypothetical protein [bacterium]
MNLKKILKVKKNKYYLLIGVIFLFLLLPLIFKVIIIRNININERWEVSDIKFSTKNINLKDLTYKDTWIYVKINDLKLKPSFIKNAFAFEGPGELLSEKERKKMSVEGKIKGNIINGNLIITSSKINIENMGNLKFYGNFSNWGKDKFEGMIELNGVNIKEILKMTKYKISFDGKIFGKVFIEKEKENFKEVKFDLEVKDILQENIERKLNLLIKGRYIPLEKKTLIEEGILRNENGEKIKFTGFISESEFEFNFDTEEFSIDEILKLLPEEIRKKYNLKIENSKLSLNKFVLNFSKKKFILMVISPFLQNFS